tara:strand:+ start:796 stop:1761 length:966 start_codon:yes stop_codon:yes gene_type:complete
MTFFITGGSGFLGSNFVKKLVQQDQRVIVYDDFSRGNLRKIDSIKTKIKIVNGDIRDEKKIINESKGCDHFFHFAAINGTEFFYKKPQEVLDVAIRGVLSSVEAAKLNNIRNFFFASSSEVYQTPKIIPTPEDVELVIPDVFNKRYSYGGGKLISELVCLNYYRDFFKKMIIFRPHNVYGPDMGDEHVIPQLIYKSYKAKQEGKDFLEIKGNGKQTRTFIHINDFTDCLIKILNFGEDRNIYHVGNTDEISIEDLLKEIHYILKLKLSIKRSKNPLGETLRRCPDNKKIKLLGYRQKMKIKDGLNDVVLWYMKHYFNKEIK